MKIHFLFPSDSFDSKMSDEQYFEEEHAAIHRSFRTSLVNHDELERGRVKLFGDIEEDATVVYRGWMINAAAGDYRRLIGSLGETRMLTDAYEYEAAHHLPGWYPYVTDLTAETVVCPLLVGKMPSAMFTDLTEGLGWKKVFMKDFVKSLKTSPGSVATTPAQADEILLAMAKYRRLEGGICYRRFEEYVPGTEVRYFVIKGKAYSPDGAAVPELVETVTKRFVKSRFYSVDVAERVDGVLRLIEIGDGQVSDLVGKWNPDNFYDLWRHQDG